MQENRKLAHIEMTNLSQTHVKNLDSRFYYEPLLASHPKSEDKLEKKFLGRKISYPLWISSMTGGVGKAKNINQNLAKLCHEFKLGMGLGSCRPLLYSDEFFSDFNLRPIIGNDLPFYANLGIAQLEMLIGTHKISLLEELSKKLEVDGVIIHVNPMQEWFQEEGDRFNNPPIETLKVFCEKYSRKIIVKEVGQGMGPLSLIALLNLPIAAIELSGFGGTNFSLLEANRSKRSHNGLMYTGHSAEEMVDFLNQIKNTEKEIIISGGINDIVDGFYLMERLQMNSVIGQAKSLLNHSENYEDLKNFTQNQIDSLKMAKSYLKVRKEESYE